MNGPQDHPNRPQPTLADPADAFEAVGQVLAKGGAIRGFAISWVDAEGRYHSVADCPTEALPVLLLGLDEVTSDLRVAGMLAHGGRHYEGPRPTRRGDDDPDYDSSGFTR